MVAVASGALVLTDVRAQAAAALAPVAPDDPEVLVDVVDSLTPPALMLIWQDPWLEPRTFGTCLWVARFAVRCVASRVEPGPGVEKLEQLVTLTTDRLAADAYPWPAATVSAPRVWPVAEVRYLFADVLYELTVTT